jgi:hypothetical protein
MLQLEFSPQVNTCQCSNGEPEVKCRVGVLAVFRSSKGNNPLSCYIDVLPYTLG